MKVAFAGGVTGGHIAPGVALAERISRDLPGSDVLFASVANEVEERMIARIGLRLVKVTGRTSRAAAAAASIPGAWLRSRRLFASFRPDLVVGLGGAASFGPAAAAIMSRTPLALIEQNVIPGTATRRLARWAGAICCQWPEAARALGPRACFTGCPVRDAILAAAAADKADARRRHFGLDPALPTLLVMGGSQGAHVLNATMTLAAPALAGRAQVIHLAGEADSPALVQAYGAAGLRSHVSSFFDAMEFAYAAADLALSRAGALSIAELAAAGVPAILVPLPHAKDDHQRANARAAAALGGCIMIEQTEFDAARAAELIGGILAARATLDAMRRCALGSARTDAADAILHILTALAERRSPAGEPSDKAVACAE